MFRRRVLNPLAALLFLVALPFVLLFRALRAVWDWLTPAKGTVVDLRKTK
jgi:hypothetical protein